MSRLKDTVDEYKRLGIDGQIDYEKFYLYSIITHSTAIEGSTVTEIENRLLFDEGISADKPMVEQLMNLDLKKAYERGFDIADRRERFTAEMLCRLSGIVMKNTGSVYNTALGSFSSADGDIRLVNVSAGGGKTYLSWQKVPDRLREFCEWLNESIGGLKKGDVDEAYRLSFMAHYILVTIHPWADGNGRMARLVMNIIQREVGVPLSVVRKERRIEYIQHLSDSQDADDSTGFIDFMTEQHIQNIREQIEEYKVSVENDVMSVVRATGREYSARRSEDDAKLPSKDDAKLPSKYDAILPSEDNVKLTSKEHAVFTQMRTDPDITIIMIMENTGFSRPTVTRAIKALKEKGLISREGSKKTGRWESKKTGRWESI